MGASGSSPLDCNIDDSPIQTTEVFRIYLCLVQKAEDPGLFGQLDPDLYQILFKRIQKRIWIRPETNIIVATFAIFPIT